MLLAKNQTLSLIFAETRQVVEVVLFLIVTETRNMVEVVIREEELGED